MTAAQISKSSRISPSSRSRPFTVASTTLTKGLQEIAAEFDRLFEEGVRRRLRGVREAARRTQRRSRRSDSDANTPSRPTRASSPRRASSRNFTPKSPTDALKPVTTAYADLQK